MDASIGDTKSIGEVGASGSARRAASHLTLDLRVSEAQWTQRQLQARIRQARRQLAEAEAVRRERPDPAATAEPVVDAEFSFGEPMVAASDLIAAEWAETSKAAQAIVDAADAEVRRLIETVAAEARVLDAEAARLRSLPITAPELATPARPSTTLVGDSTPAGD